MASGEYHIASFVVRVRPEHGASVSSRIAALPGLEVHAQDNGKLIVTAEAGDVRELAERVQWLEAVESIVTVAPVYHEFEQDQDADGDADTATETIRKSSR